jgi:hypothetical protein
MVMPYFELHPSIYLEELRQTILPSHKELNPLISEILTIMNDVRGYVLKEVITAYYTIISLYLHGETEKKNTSFNIVDIRTNE